MTLYLILLAGLSVPALAQPPGQPPANAPSYSEVAKVEAAADLSGLLRPRSVPAIFETNVPSTTQAFSAPRGKKGGTGGKGGKGGGGGGKGGKR
jgi:hypothetical protein